MYYADKNKKILNEPRRTAKQRSRNIKKPSKPDNSNQDKNNIKEYNNHNEDHVNARYTYLSYIKNFPLIISGIMKFLTNQSNITRDMLSIYYLTKFNSRNATIADTLNILTMSIVDVLFKQKNNAQKVLILIRLVKLLERDLPNVVDYIHELSNTRKPIDLDFIYTIGEQIDTLSSINEGVISKLEKGNLIEPTPRPGAPGKLDFLKEEGLLPDYSAIEREQELIKKEVTLIEIKKALNVLVKDKNLDKSKYNQLVNEHNQAVKDIVALKLDMAESYKERQVPILEPHKKLKQTISKAIEVKKIVSNQQQGKQRNQQRGNQGNQQRGNQGNQQRGNQGNQQRGNQGNQQRGNQGNQQRGNQYQNK